MRVELHLGSTCNELYFLVSYAPQERVTPLQQGLRVSSYSRYLHPVPDSSSEIIQSGENRQLKFCPRPLGINLPCRGHLSCFPAVSTTLILHFILQ